MKEDLNQMICFYVFIFFIFIFSFIFFKSLKKDENSVKLAESLQKFAFKNKNYK